MKKILSKIHLYLSIPVGLVISITCLTGAAMVLDKDIHRLFNTDLYEVEEVKTEALPIDELTDHLLSQFPEGERVEKVQIFRDHSSSYQFSLKEAAGLFFVNQYTGDLLGNHDFFRKGGFYRTMFHTHRWLMNYNRDFSWGKQIVGISTLLLVFIIISGFFIWLPRGIYSLKKGLSINVRRGWRRFWYDLHVAGGVYIGGGLLVLALTGLMWSFSWYRPMVFSMFGVEVSERGRQKKEDEKTIKYEHWGRVLKEVQQKEDKIESILLSDGEAYVYNRKYGNNRAYDKYNFNKDSGTIEKIEPYLSRPESSRFMGWVYAIHVGSWGGMASKMLTFIISLLGGILPITGYYLWFKKKFKKKK